MLQGLRLLWHRWATRRKMDRVFGRGEDPYGYGHRPYERGRLEAMERLLSGGPPGQAAGPWRSALEVGCAEGAFTRRLARLASQVTALELSSVALHRARSSLAGEGRVAFAEADVRLWSPPAGAAFDAVVVGDVLYYLDKRGVRDQFEAVFGRIAGWLEPGGRLLLAHGFASEAERALRRGYRERFERLGLRLVAEEVAGTAEKDGDVRCLLSLLEKPRAG